MGQQRALLAGQGSVLDEGSPLDIQMDSAGLAELDAVTVRANYGREAYGQEVQGMNYAAQASLHDSKINMLGTYLSATGSLLGGLASAYGGYKPGKIQNGIV